MTNRVARRLLVLGVLVITTAACAARERPSVGASDPTRWEGDPRLYQLLAVFPLDAAQEDSLAQYSADHADAMNEQLAIAAEDPNAASVMRANALLMLARRKATAQLGTFRVALDDSDVRVRATAVAALREFVELRPAEALQLARTALQDSAVEVQVQALNILGDREHALLRAYLRGDPPRELAGIARGLIAVAEERGAPLSGDSAGMLRRTTTHGHVLTFTPVQHWPQWDAAYGDVTVVPANGAPFTLQRIEVVNHVIPVFFSPAGELVVYERDRTIFVRAVASGAERAVGQGIAPRPRPFTDDIVFLRELPENSRVEQRERTIIRYDVLVAPFRAGAQPERIASTTVATSFDVRGGYSAARWARIEQHGGQFYIVADGMDMVELPSPFGTGTGR